MSALNVARRQLAPWATLALLMLTGLMGGAVQAAQVACTPSEGFTNCIRVTYSGAAETFTRPTGVTLLNVRLWGAGGGGPNSVYYLESSGGGGGGFSTGTLNVSSLATLSLRVGQGGVTGSTALTYGGGGSGGASGNKPGGSGGGYSAIFTGTATTAATALIVAGGGGGGAQGADVQSPTAGAGGGTSGNNSSSTTSGGSGGTPTAGGGAATTTTGCTTAATAGALFQGGNGAAVGSDGENGGGGGGGYYGGGGGRCQTSGGTVPNGPGGGGSSYVGHTSLSSASTTAGTNGSFNAVGGAAAQPANDQYTSGIGTGGGTGGNGTAAGNGQIVIQWVSPRVQITKTTLAGTTGTNVFAFTHAGLQTLAGVATGSSSLSVTGAGSVSGATYAAPISVARTITETPPAGFRTNSIQCVDANAATNGNVNPVVSSNVVGVSSITIPAAALKGGGAAAGAAVITCTFTNERVLPPTLSKTFSPASIAAGATSVLTITLANPVSTAASLTAALTDGLPAGVTVAATPGASTTCTGSGAVVAAANSGSVSLPATFSIPAGTPGGAAGSCTVTVNVTSSTSGTVTNTLAAGALQTSHGNNATDATANLTVLAVADLGITKSNGVSSVLAGSSTVYTIVVNNAGPAAANGAVLKDPALANLTVTGLSCGSAIGGAVCPSVTPTAMAITALQGAVGLMIPTLPSGASLTFLVTGTAGASGTTISNVASVAPPAGTTDPSPASATDTDTIVAAGAANSGVRTVVNGASADGVATNVLEVLVRTPGGSPAGVGAGAVVSFAGQPGVSLNGAALGAATTCTTTAASTCQVTAASLNAGPFTTSITVGGVALGGTFAAGGNNYTPTASYGFVTTTIQFTKALSASRVVATDQFTVVIRTGGVSGTVVNSTASSTTAGSGASVTAGSGTTGSYAATPGTAYTLTEAAAGGANLANYSGLLTCVDTAGVQTSGLPVAEPFNPANGRTITPVAGAALACTLTNARSGSGVSGFVYNDANHNAGLEASEAGTGLGNLFVKLAPLSGGTCQAPAASVSAAVNVATGAYSLPSVAAGSYCLILDNNSSLNDITPALPAQWLGTQNPSGVIQLSVSQAPLPSQNFGLYNGSKLSGKVFIDDGAGGGIANNGLQAGSEAGRAGVAVRAMQGGLAVDSASTAGDGSYTLWLPVTTSGTVTVTPVPPAGHLATGGAAGSTGGSYSRPSVSYTAAAGLSYTGVNFGLVPPNTLGPNGAQTAQPGTTVSYAHTYSAGTGGQVSFTLSHLATPAIPGWSQLLYLDSNCNATLEASELTVSAALTVSAGQTVCLVVKQFVPAGAGIGVLNSVSLSAAFSYSNASPALALSTLLATDVTTVSATGDLSLAKLVSNVTQAIAAATEVKANPGDTLQYTLTATNHGSQALSTLSVNDATPAFTTYVSAACPATLPTGITACTVTTQPAVGGQGTLVWSFAGALASSAQLSVTYVVQLDF